MGEKCERKGSAQENTVIAVSSTVAVFVVMLVVTITTAVCLKKKYSQVKENGESLNLEVVSILLLSTNMYISTHLSLSIYLLKSKQSNSIGSWKMFHF